MSSNNNNLPSSKRSAKSLEAIKKAAREYALSGTTTSKGGRKKKKKDSKTEPQKPKQTRKRKRPTTTATQAKTKSAIQPTQCSARSSVAQTAATAAKPKRTKSTSSTGHSAVRASPRRRPARVPSPPASPLPSSDAEDEPSLSPQHHQPLDIDDVRDMDDYEFLIHSLGWNDKETPRTDDWLKLLEERLEDDDEDDEEDGDFAWNLDEDDDDDDMVVTRFDGVEWQVSRSKQSIRDDEWYSGRATTVATGHHIEANTSEAATADDDLEMPSDWEADFYQQLEEELGWLEEEDMEAAVTTLLDNPSANNDHEDSVDSTHTMNAKHSEHDHGEDTPKAAGGRTAPPPEHHPTTTPYRDMRPSTARPAVTDEQRERLRRLLQSHTQLLLQQSVLSVRAAHQHSEQRRKDSERQREHAKRNFKVTTPATTYIGVETPDELIEILDGAVGMLQDLNQHRKDAIRHFVQFGNSDGRRLSKRERRLTRAQFTKTLQEQERGEAITIFAVPGLHTLNATFNKIDKSVQGVETEGNILQFQTNPMACEFVLEQAEAVKDERLIPGRRDLSANFVDPTEFFGPEFRPPCTDSQQMLFRRNVNLFTSGEDNLVLRGVNLYGEKQWMLIGDRYLPERSFNIISQRFAKICVLVYKTRGIQIDAQGNLLTPPKFESVDDLDEEAVGKLKPVQPPAILNVHRWSLEEDLCLLRVVPLMGNMWAEISARFLPHRDRGHLRKRYQVLERRIQTAVQRSNKEEAAFTRYRWKSASTTTSPGRLSAASSPGRHVASPATLPANRGAVNQAAAILASAKGYAASAGMPPPPRPNPGRAIAPPALALQQSTDEASRGPLDNVLGEESSGWSQFSAMNDVSAHNNTENMVASTIVTQLAKSQVPPGDDSNDTYVRMNLDQEDPSGLSVLDSVMEQSRSRMAPSGDSRMASSAANSRMASQKTNSSGSLFAGVLSRTKQIEAAGGRVRPPQSTRPGPDGTHGTETRGGQQRRHSSSSKSSLPLARNASGGTVPPPPASPRRRQRLSQTSSQGSSTPTELSAAWPTDTSKFHAGFPVLPGGSDDSPASSSPSKNNNLLGGNDTNSNSMLEGWNMKAFGSDTTSSNQEGAAIPSQSQNDDKDWDDDAATAAMAEAVGMSQAQSTRPLSREVPFSAMGPDLADAINALSSLSHSPPKKKKQTVSVVGMPQRQQPESRTNESSTQKTSLFAKVVGSAGTTDRGSGDEHKKSKNSTKRRKLQF